MSFQIVIIYTTVTIECFTFSAQENIYNKASSSVLSEVSIFSGSFFTRPALNVHVCKDAQCSWTLLHRDSNHWHLPIDTNCRLRCFWRQYVPFHDTNRKWNALFSVIYSLRETFYVILIHYIHKYLCVFKILATVYYYKLIQQVVVLHNVLFPFIHRKLIYQHALFAVDASLQVNKGTIQTQIASFQSNIYAFICSNADMILDTVWYYITLILACKHNFNIPGWNTPLHSDGWGAIPMEHCCK